MADDDRVNEREYGRLIATVEHLASVVEGLQKQYSHNTTKLQARLDQVLQTTTPRGDYERLLDNVAELWQYSRETRTRVDRIDGSLEPNEWIMRWGLRSVCAVVTAGIGALIYAAF
jgi:hypothetical protein